MHTGLLVSVTKGYQPITQLIALPDDFGIKEMHEYIECDIVDAARLTDEIDIWVDDEGLLKPGNIILEYQLKDSKEEPLLLAGNALFLSYNEEGESLGLTMEQLDWIGHNLTIRPYAKTKE